MLGTPKFCRLVGTFAFRFINVISAGRDIDNLFGVLWPALRDGRFIRTVSMHGRVLEISGRGGTGAMLS